MCCNTCCKCWISISWLLVWSVLQCPRRVRKSLNVVQCDSNANSGCGRFAWKMTSTPEMCPCFGNVLKKLLWCCVMGFLETFGSCGIMFVLSCWGLICLKICVEDVLIFQDRIVKENILLADKKCVPTACPGKILEFQSSKTVRTLLLSFICRPW